MDRRQSLNICVRPLVFIVDGHDDIREGEIMDSPGEIFIDQRVLERLRAEYLEMPGMRLRIEQVQRLFGIEQTMCRAALDELLKARFLCLKSDGTYVRKLPAA